MSHRYDYYSQFQSPGFSTSGSHACVHSAGTNLYLCIYIEPHILQNNITIEIVSDMVQDHYHALLNWMGGSVSNHRVEEQLKKA